MSNLFNVTFEDNDLIHPSTGFDAVEGKGGTFEISAAAAYTGSYGLAYTPLAGYKMFGNKRFPVTKRMRVALWFSLNTFTISEGVYTPIMYHFQYINAFCLRLSRLSGLYRLNVISYQDSGASNGDYYNIDTNWHLIEIDWKASSAPGANDGFCYWWIDGDECTQRTSIDSDQRYVISMFLGTYSANDHNGSAGTMYFDHWRANNDGSVIGA